MFKDLKVPLGVKAIIQPLNDYMTLYVIQCFAKVAVPLFDLVRRKWFFSF
jgi:hypothetical protein